MCAVVPAGNLRLVHEDAAAARQVVDSRPAAIDRLAAVAAAVAASAGFAPGVVAGCWPAGGAVAGFAVWVCCAALIRSVVDGWTMSVTVITTATIVCRFA